MFKQYGHHYILEVSGVDQMKLDDVDFFYYMFQEQQQLAHSTQLEFHYHKFHPVGLTQIQVLQESHISVHTFPEDLYQQIDLFTCSKEDPKQQIDYIIARLQPEQYDLKYIPRGIPHFFNMGQTNTKNRHVFKGVEHLYK